MKSFENIELFQPDPPAAGGADYGAGNIQAVPGRTAGAVTSEADLIKEIRDQVAKGNADARVQALLQQVLLLTDNIKKNTDVERNLEAMPAQIGVMIKMLGKILDGFGMENGLVEFVDNDPFFQFNGSQVQPNLSSLSGFTGTVQNPLENRTVMGDITGGTNTAIAAERRVPEVVGDSVASLPNAAGNTTTPPPAGSPTTGTREPITISRALDAGKDLTGAADVRSINTAFTTADANRNGTLEATETPAFRQALTPAAREKLEPLFL